MATNFMQQQQQLQQQLNGGQRRPATSAIHVDVIVPVHNAQSTIEDAVKSAMNQQIPPNLKEFVDYFADDNVHCDENNNSSSSSLPHYELSIAVCCYDDGSTDQSLQILQRLQKEYQQQNLEQQLEECLGDNSNDDSDGRHARSTASETTRTIPSRLLVQSSRTLQPDHMMARGAGFARNRAIEMNDPKNKTTTGVGIGGDDDDVLRFLCWLDSDDIMHPYRVAYQTLFMIRLTDSRLGSVSFESEMMHRTLLGSTFDRDPPDSTWHYSQWANSLLLKDQQRLMLEIFREVTVIQPTWFMSRRHWNDIGPYVEAPLPPPPQALLNAGQPIFNLELIQGVIDKHQSDHPRSYCLVHPTYDTTESLRLAEDLRLYYSHIKNGGIIKIVCHRISCGSGSDVDVDVDVDTSSIDTELLSPEPLVTYRQLSTGSQSFRTSRRLLLSLRCKAFQDLILRDDNKDWWRGGSGIESSTMSNATSKFTQHQRQNQQQKFAIWGAGRDGKEFFKMLDEANKQRVYCFVDVDIKKLQSGYYVDHCQAKSDVDGDRDATSSNADEMDDVASRQKKIKNRKKGKDKRTNKYKIPIVHFSYLASNPETRRRLQEELLNGGADNDAIYGRIDKSRNGDIKITDDNNQEERESIGALNPPESKKPKLEEGGVESGPDIHTKSLSGTPSNKKHRPESPSLAVAATVSKSKLLLNARGLDMELLQKVPVVVCVAMYRTNGVLERNVASIGRIEGQTLWHFS